MNINKYIEQCLSHFQFKIANNDISKYIIKGTSITNINPKLALVSGGGRKNFTLMNLLNQRSKINFVNIDDFGWDGDNFEAEAFGKVFSSKDLMEGISSFMMKQRDFNCNGDSILSLGLGLGLGSVNSSGQKSIFL